MYVQDLSKYVFKLLSCRGNKDIFTSPKQLYFKSLNEPAPPHLRSLFKKNSQSTSYRLRNALRNLRVPKKVQKPARNAFRLGCETWEQPLS